MKHIDETMLLLAVGNVGEDLVARAEKRSVPSRRRVSLALCCAGGLLVPDRGRGGALCDGWIWLRK